MVGLAEASLVAGILGNSVSAVDKIYNWWRESRGQSKASLAMVNQPEAQALSYIRLDKPGSPVKIAISYGDLARKLQKEDVQYIEGFGSRMQNAMVQWNALNAGLPLADAVERARIEANMEQLKNRDICASLRQVIDFIDKLGIDLEDHYTSARQICL